MVIERDGANKLLRRYIYGLDLLSQTTPTKGNTISPVVLAAPNGRSMCTDSNGATAPNCLTVTPSP